MQVSFFFHGSNADESVEALTNELVTETMPFVDTSVDVDPDVKALGIYGLLPSYRCEGRVEPQFLGCGRSVIEGRRLLWTTSVRTAMIAQAAMYPAQPDADIDGLIKFIFTFTAPQLKWMEQHGLHIVHNMQFPNTLIWIPAGWLVFERTSSEQVVGIKFSGFDAHRPTLVNLKLLRGFAGKGFKR